MQLFFLCCMRDLSLVTLWRTVLASPATILTLADSLKGKTNVNTLPLPPFLLTNDYCAGR